MPEPSDARLPLKSARRWFRRMMPKQKRCVWGYIFAVETGHELAVKHPTRKAGGWNLHVHALYYGPFINWRIALEIWKELTAGEGEGFYIRQCPGWRKDPDRAVRWALVHYFGYILKPAALTAERIAALEVLFSRMRRVHGGGCFYHLPKDGKPILNLHCPKCGRDLPINLRAWRKSERRSVAELESDGRRDCRELYREQRRAGAFGSRAP